jgi:hypothetical protein
MLTDSISPPVRAPVNPRSVCIGTALAALLAGAVPYNDFVVGDGFLIACYLPVFFVFFAFVLSVLVNAPLRRWLPHRALDGGELAVITLMVLTAAAIPCQGLLRSLIPALVYPFHHGNDDAEFWKAFSAIGLPGWLFPVGNPATGRSNPVVLWFFTTAPAGAAVPYLAWVRPLLGWSVFLVCMFTTLVTVALIVFPQWSVAERLAFPIAQVELALVEQPEAGRALNLLFRSRLFWIGTAAAFVLQGAGPLHAYFPQYVPDVKVQYDLRNVMTGEPWRYLSVSVQQNGITFVYLAMAYFIQARAGFSIWTTFLILQLVRVAAQAEFEFDLSQKVLLDQHLGGSIAFLAGIFWIGRHGWWKLLTDRKRRRPGLFIAAMAGIVGMVAWLSVVGVSLAMSLTSVAFILLAHLVTARVVAETGLPIFRSWATPGQIFMRLDPGRFTGRDVYFTQLISTIGTYTTRESVMPFVQHGIWVTHKAAGKSAVRGLGWVIGWSLAVSFVIGSWSSLHAYYHHFAPLTRQLKQTKINEHGVEIVPTQTVADPLTAWSHHKFAASPHRPFVQMGIGMAVVIVLFVLSARSQAWPLVPIGFIVCTTAGYGDLCWYSVLLGWLAKAIVLKFGGPSMYQAGKPLMIGLIVGEALASGVWLGINLLLAGTGHDYHPVVIYPS